MGHIPNREFYCEMCDEHFYESVERDEETMTCPFCGNEFCDATDIDDEKPGDDSEPDLIPMVDSTNDGINYKPPLVIEGMSRGEKIFNAVFSVCIIAALICILIFDKGCRK